MNRPTQPPTSINMNSNHPPERPTLPLDKQLYLILVRLCQILVAIPYMVLIAWSYHHRGYWLNMENPLLCGGIHLPQTPTPSPHSANPPNHHSRCVLRHILLHHPSDTDTQQTHDRLPLPDPVRYPSDSGMGRHRGVHAVTQRKGLQGKLQQAPSHAVGMGYRSCRFGDVSKVFLILLGSMNGQYPRS